MAAQTKCLATIPDSNIETQIRNCRCGFSTFQTNVHIDSDRPFPFGVPNEHPLYNAAIESLRSNFWGLKGTTSAGKNNQRPTDPGLCTARKPSGALGNPNRSVAFLKLKVYIIYMAMV